MPHYLHPPADLLKTHPHLTHQAHQLSLAYRYKKVVTEEQLQIIGAALWQTLVDNGQSLPTLGADRQTLVLLSEDLSIQALPWECLYHPELGFIATHNGFSFSRVLTTELQQTRLEKGVLRVLLFSSLPNGVSRLDIEEEQAQVLTSLNPAVQAGEVELDMPDDGRFSTLQAMLREKTYHLLFLSGHGHYHYEHHQPDESYAAFVFEDDQGNPDLIKAPAIADALIGSGVQCVVLSACQSAHAEFEQQAQLSLLQQLVSLGLAHVVGMRESILDSAGIRFAASFCQTIAQRQRVDVALQYARQAMQQQTPLARPLRKEFNIGKDEIGQSQWSLPLLFSQNPAQALIDWDFTPQPPRYEHHFKNFWQDIPSFATGRFIGRRNELRQLSHDFVHGSQQQLLITGRGGQGKTALATRLAQKLEQQGYHVVVFVATPQSQWHDLLPQLLHNRFFKDQWRTFIQQVSSSFKTKVQENHALLQFLFEQTQGKILFFFDNLESIQHPKTRELKHKAVAEWINTIQRFPQQGVKLLLTSRYRLPDWHDDDHHGLQIPNADDFAYFLQRQGMTFTPKQQQQLYHDLDGNFRGVAYFKRAWQSNADFARVCQQAQQKLQTNQALAVLYQQLSKEEQQLLITLQAYQSPIPARNITALNYQTERLTPLLQYGLLNQSEAGYQVPTVISDWLQQQGHTVSQADKEQAVADYVAVFEQAKPQTIKLALSVYVAYRYSGQMEEARQFAYDHIIGYFYNAGLYQILLDEWLPEIKKTNSEKLKGSITNHIGLTYLNLDNYDTALHYLQQALLIALETNNKLVMASAINNISQIFHFQGKYVEALRYLQKSLRIVHRIKNKTAAGIILNNICEISHSHGEGAAS